MTSEQNKLAFFQALLWAAWADDALLRVEQDMVRDLMGNAGLSQDEAATVEGWFEEPPDEPEWTPFANDSDMAEALMRDYAMVVLVDKVVNLDEMAQLDHVRERIGMEESTLHAILKEVEASLAQRLGED